MNVAIQLKLKSHDYIQILKLMRNEMVAKNMPDGNLQFNHKAIFLKFCEIRKIKVLKYLFSLKNEFDFSTSLFILTLENNHYDIAALLNMDFRYLMRDNSTEENRQIVSLITSSLKKVHESGGMLD